MTTRRQSEANRANAKASTGPKSAAGKRRVSQNARRHGLTTAPPWDQVNRWYRIITNDPRAQPVPTSPDPRDQAALRLAEAEAQVERTTTAERAHVLDLHDRLQEQDDQVPLLERVLGRALETGFDVGDYETLRLMALQSEDPFVVGAARILARCSPTRPAALRQRMRTFTRYRRDAESARRRALKAWLRANE